MSADARRQVVDLLRKYPGLHEREVERRLGFSSRLAAYHLEALAAEGLVRRFAQDGFARYVLADEARRLTRADFELLLLLRRPVLLRICLLLLKEGESTPSALARALDLAKPSVSHHLRTLVEGGHARVRPEGRERWISLAAPEHVAWVLATYPPLPEDLDRFSAVWRDLVG